MNIVSNYIWEKAADGGRNPVSLALQQVRLRGREICLFCVCDSPGEESGGRMTEQLVEWFHRKCLPACGHRALPSHGNCWSLNCGASGENCRARRVIHNRRP